MLVLQSARSGREDFNLLINKDILFGFHFLRELQLISVQIGTDIALSVVTIHAIGKGRGKNLSNTH